MSDTSVRWYLCDVCGEHVREPGRWRHADCPPPAIPEAAAEVIAKLKARET